MIAEWLSPLLQWTGLTIIELALLIIAIILIIKLIKD